MQPFELPDFYVPWPARQNPNLEFARAHSKTWAREMGILGASCKENFPIIWDEEGFDRHDYALLCAYVHPEAPTPELNLMTDWNVWAFYVDDYFLQVYKGSKDRAAAKAYLDSILVFMPVDLGPSPAPTNPTERALADLWQRTAPSKSEDWRIRIAEDTRSLLDAFLWELDNKNQGRLANPIEYIEMRRQVGAALWSADLVEHAMFVEIPKRIAAARPMQVLKNTFADAVHLRNDIFSYQREVLKQGELTNAVLVIERFLDVETQRAVNLVNDLLTSRLQQFEHTAITELAPLFVENQLDPQEQVDVLNYIRGLQDWQSGAHEWHIQTSRYLNPNSGQTASSRNFFPPRPRELGAAAARITPNSLGLNRLKNYRHLPYPKVGPIKMPKCYMPFEPKMNPNLETARQHEKAWARQMGMLDKLPGDLNIFIWDEHRFDVTDLALFDAQAHPNATAVQLNLAADWVVWGTYTDDYFMMMYARPCDMAGAKIFHHRLSEFTPVDITSLPPTPLTPVERGLADLWVRTSETLTLDERCSLHKFLEDMIGIWLGELSDRIQNRIPDPIDYIETRRISCGSGIMMTLPRSVHGRAIPPEVQRTLTMQELNNTAIDYGALTNDIFSYQKEIEFEGQNYNAVLVIENFLGCDRMQAFEIANNLMTTRMQQFEHIVKTELPVLFENFNMDIQSREQVLSYVKELQHYMCGSLEWHITTSRYKEFEFRRPIGSFASHLAGLGTSAARVLELINGEQSVVTTHLEQACKSPPATDKELRIFAVSHLKPPFAPKKEEAQPE